MDIAGCQGRIQKVTRGIRAPIEFGIEKESIRFHPRMIEVGPQLGLGKKAIGVVRPIVALATIDTIHIACIPDSWEEGFGNEVGVKRSRAGGSLNAAHYV